MAAGGDEIGYVRRLVEALQVLRGAQSVEVRGAWATEEEARAVVVDFVQVFELDVVITELADGFRVEARGRPERTISEDVDDQRPRRCRVECRHGREPVDSCRGLAKQLVERPRRLVHTAESTIAPCAPALTGSSACRRSTSPRFCAGSPRQAST